MSSRAAVAGFKKCSRVHIDKSVKTLYETSCFRSHPIHPSVATLYTYLDIAQSFGFVAPLLLSQTNFLYSIYCFTYTFTQVKGNMSINSSHPSHISVN